MYVMWTYVHREFFDHIWAVYQCVELYIYIYIYIYILGDFHYWRFRCFLNLDNSYMEAGENALHYK